MESALGAAAAPGRLMRPMSHCPPFRRGDALLLVDVQNDFLPGGALAVPGGDEVVPLLNQYLAHFAREGLPVFASHDWHPEDHCSFHRQGGSWPPHCVRHTLGAAAAAGLELPAGVAMVAKGTERDTEAYSAFTGTDLEARLRAAQVRRLYVGGLATDYCVLQTVRDALRRGFAVFLLRDAIRAVNLEAGDGARAEEEMSALGAVSLEIDALAHAEADPNALLTDWYQFTMLRGYHAEGMDDVAVFEFFVRRLPAGWNFLVAAGLEQALDFLEAFRFTPADLEWLRETAGFDATLIGKLRDLRFTGDVHAMPEGTIFFPDEPVLRVTAPLPQAQIVETRLVNLLHFQTLIASQAVRCVLAAPGRSLVDFGLRRAHGAEAGLLAARACYLAGFTATSDVMAGRRFGIPGAGTMAHSFIEACPSEEEAFLRFARANPEQVVLLLDTYDTEAAAARVVRLAPGLRAEGIAIRGVRLDSGDLGTHARRVRRILDAGGLQEVTIFASGNLDEHELARLHAAAAPIDGFGVGTRVTTAAGVAYLDCAYKLQAYAGRPCCKHSEGKATWPGVKQVYRHFTAEGRLECDTIALAAETRVGEPLLERVMHHGCRVAPPPPLTALRDRVRRQWESLPAGPRGLAGCPPWPVHKSAALQELAGRLGAFSIGATIPPQANEDDRGRRPFLHRRQQDPAAGEEAGVEPARALVRTS